MNKFNPKNSVYQNWNKKLYIARKIGVTYDDYNNQIIEYDKPFYFGRVNYQPINSRELQDYMSAYGETNNKLISLLIDSKDRNKFKEFDLAYLYGATPDGEKVYGDNANYLVKAFKEQNTKIAVILVELTKDNTIEEEVING